MSSKSFTFNKYLLTGQLEVNEFGAWYLKNLFWDKLCIQEQDTKLCAGWEFSLNDVRHVPHEKKWQSLELVVKESGESLSLRCPQLSSDNRFQVDYCLRLHAFGLEQWLEIHNHHSHKLKIDNMNFTQFRFNRDFLYGLQVHRSFNETPEVLTEMEYGLEDPVLCLETLSGHGFALVNMAPGHSRRMTTGVYTSVGYANHRSPFQTMIPPGEVFCSDKAVALPFKDIGEAREKIYQFLQSKVRKGRKLLLKPTYCSWEPFGRDIDEEKMIAQIDRASELGFETFIIDDGWQDHAGDWKVDPGRFPRGLSPLVSRLKEKKMNLGLWISLTTLSAKSQAFQRFKDCLLVNEEGHARMTQVFEGDMAMACLNSSYSEHIFKCLEALICEHELTYLKIDLPTVYDVYNRPALQCFAKNHEHEAGRDYMLNTYRVVGRIMKRLKKSHPKVILDLTFELWGAWQIMDPALIDYADVCWLSNIRDHDKSAYGPFQARALAQRHARIMPPGHCVVGNLRLNGPKPLESLASSFISFPMLLGDLQSIPKESKGLLQRAIQNYKKLSREIDLSASFYELRDMESNSKIAREYNGYLLWDHQNKKGLLAVFRNLSDSTRGSLSNPLTQLGLKNDEQLLLEPWLEDSGKAVSAHSSAPSLSFDLSAKNDVQLYTVSQ